MKTLTQLLTLIFLLQSTLAWPSTTTSNMGLLVPAVGDTDYATSISSSLTSIDAHDHTTGKGVQIPAGGLESNSVTAAKIAAAVAGNGLAGGAGTALSVGVDGSTVEISSDQVRVKDLGITTAKLNDGAVTQAKRAALGQQVSSGSGSASTSSTTYVDVTNLSVSITTTGRPVMLLLIGDVGGVSEIECNNSTTNRTCVYAFLRDSTTLSESRVGSDLANDIRVPTSSLQYVDVPTAGTYTYKVQHKVSGTSTVSTVLSAKLVAYEL